MLKNYRLWDKLIAAFLLIHVFRSFFNPHLGFNNSIAFSIYSPLDIFEILEFSVAIVFSVTIIISGLLYLVIITLLVKNKPARIFVIGLTAVTLFLTMFARLVLPYYGNFDYLVNDEMKEEYLEFQEMINGQNTPQKLTEETLLDEVCESHPSYHQNISNYKWKDLPDSSTDSDNDGIPDVIESLSNCPQSSTETNIYPSFLVKMCLFLSFIYLLFIRPKIRTRKL